MLPISGSTGKRSLISIGKRECKTCENLVNCPYFVECSCAGVEDHYEYERSWMKRKLNWWKYVQQIQKGAP